MLAPPQLANEAHRVQAAEQCGLLDTTPDPQFDDLVLLAATMCHTPIAVVGFMGPDQQFLKARIGVTERTVPRNLTFCAHTLAQNDLFIVSDTLLDARFKTHPAVTGDPGVRFYAGMPIIDSGGYALGTVCVVDIVPRELSAQQQRSLRIIARHVLIHIEIRKSELKTKVDSIPRA